MIRRYASLCELVIRLAFFTCVGLLVVLSWLPGDAMVRTGVGGRVEHAVAYLGTAVVMGVAYRERPRLPVQSLLLVALAGILEVGQLHVPGRTVAFLDFAASSIGAVLGGLLMRGIRPSLVSWLGLDREGDERA